MKRLADASLTRARAHTHTHTHTHTQKRTSKHLYVSSTLARPSWRGSRHNSTITQRYMLRQRRPTPIPPALLPMMCTRWPSSVSAALCQPCWRGRRGGRRWGLWRARSCRRLTMTSELGVRVGQMTMLPLRRRCLLTLSALPSCSWKSCIISLLTCCHVTRRRDRLRESASGGWGRSGSRDWRWLSEISGFLY